VPPTPRSSLACLAVALSTVLATLAAAPAPAAPPAQQLTQQPTQAKASPAAKGSRPNIVLITTDDQADHELREMPRTMRLLARKGVEFTRAISPHPLCCPARAEILTGTYAHNNGVKHNTGRYGGYDRFATYRDGRNLRQNIGVWLRDRGYRTALVGKMLNGYERDSPRPRGWTRWDPAFNDVYSYRDVRFGNDGRPRRTRGYVTDVIAQRANVWIRDAATRDKPFFTWISHVAPHDGTRGGRFIGRPIPADRHRDDFGRARLPAAGKPSFNEKDVSDKPAAVRRAEPLDRGDLTAMYRDRLRSLAAVDEANAATIRVLSKAGVLDETLVVFTSDNGYLFGEHRLKGKNEVYEENLQVPLVLRGPGIPRDERTTAQATLIDVTATVLDAAGAYDGLAKRRRVDGVSLLDRLPGATGDAVAHDTALVQAGTANKKAVKKKEGWLFRGVRTGRYTYTRRWDGAAELYDRREDPHELRNLLHPDKGRLRRGASAYVDVLRALKQRYRALKDCRGPSQCQPDLKPLPPVRES